MKQRPILAVMAVSAIVVGGTAYSQSGDGTSTAQLPDCEWCGAAEAPANLSAVLVIPQVGEVGEPLIIEGTVYRTDGTTPAAGVLLYTYHTDAGGLYPKRGNETGNARRHGYLRGWLRTGADGRYRIETIKPGSYPTRSEPAHVHMTVQAPGEPERYIDDVVFEGDPLLKPDYRARLQQRGGSGIGRLGRSTDGVLRVTRDVVLGRK